MQTETDSSGTPAVAERYSRKNPFLAKLTRHDLLTRPGSRNDTRHFVIDLAGSGLRYQPGDSLGVFGQNPPELVDEVIDLTGLRPGAPVTGPAGEPVTVRQALLRHYTLNRANRKIIAGLAERVPQGEKRNRLMEILHNPDLLCEYIETRDYVDVLREFREAAFETPEGFLSQLTPVAPRLYSIASSPLPYPDQAHLCIAVVRYETHGRPKKGLASGFFADHTNVFVKNIPVYVQESKTFRLPLDTSADIIMVGPGTGIAPFRAFLQHRVAQGGIGRNWLFFGEQHRATDFLYEQELLGYERDGRLHRLDLAFSRDQEHKIYVQHRMLERSQELWAWLQNGAYFYVCGDARRMAKDVHETLIEIAAREGGLARDQAEEYINVRLMKTEKRYLRDVY